MPKQDAKRVLVTGATGFLGSHLTEALIRAGHKVTALARRTPSAAAHDRVLETVGRVGGSVAPSDLSLRLDVVEGDISLPRLGLDESQFRRLKQSVDEVWHCAASLSFLEDDREEIFRMNVGGTREVLAFVRSLARPRLHHISTAYVAGDRHGTILEDELDVGQRFRNPYEGSKCEAEKLVRSAESSGGVATTVYRPSIVIGDSVSGRATHFHGVYAFIRGLWTVARRLHRSHPGVEIVDLPLRIQGSQDTTLNFVPVDFVTRAIMEISESSLSRGRTFHVTNPTPTKNQLWLTVVCRQLGVRGVRLVGPESFADEPMTRMESLFHRQMTFYSPYLSGEPEFDCSGTLEVLAPSSVRCPIVTSEFAARMTGWYIDLLNGDGKP